MFLQLNRIKAYFKSLKKLNIEEDCLIGSLHVNIKLVYFTFIGRNLFGNKCLASVFWNIEEKAIVLIGSFLFREIHPCIDMRKKTPHENNKINVRCLIFAGSAWFNCFKREFSLRICACATSPKTAKTITRIFQVL